MTAVLELDAISKRIGGAYLNRDVSVTVRPGERRALVGPNGAGKTTLMNMAAGVLRPSEGRVRLLGRDVTALPVHRRARLGLARTFQITSLLPAMTVAENLAIAVQATSRRRADPLRPWSRARAVWARVDELLERGGLTRIKDVPVGRLAYGEQRRVEIVIAVANPCSLILLDEPGAGLSSEETEELLSLVFGLDPQLAVLFVDHDLDLVFRLATHVTLLNFGEVVAEGAPAEVRAMPVLREIYLEVGADA
ncbi:ABC transporter ATP-binding protein [Actinomadura bangladeshensis]|uniref:ABC transporter ATP-binding protein n=1 Tax=Actinomadura bangladeshensis TaxID=453573 RepID=A0A4R4P2S2_9ACTN|nr:ABC transporter ATP-binding protein [Actinomadura bangladeshensis]TDC16601.1 ABC transporter ATP-binding protein [Actinomadura bangladeshensis]